MRWTGKTIRKENQHFNPSQNLKELRAKLLPRQTINPELLLSGPMATNLPLPNREKPLRPKQTPIHSPSISPSNPSRHTSGHRPILNRIPTPILILHRDTYSPNLQPAKPDRNPERPLLARSPSDHHRLRNLRNFFVFIYNDQIF